MHRAFIYLLFLSFWPVFAHGPVDDLIKVKTKEIQAAPDNARLYLERALLNERHQDWAACEKDLFKAKALKEDLTDFNYFLGRIEMARANDQKAIEYFDLSLKQNPKNFDITFAKGRAYFSMKKYSLAAECFDQAFEYSKDCQPNHTIERVQAHLLAKNTEVEKIMDMIKDALKEFGPVLMLQIELYNLLQKHEMYEEALTALDQVLKNVSRKEKWLIEKARCYISLKQKAKAAENLKLVKQIFADMPASIKKRRLIAALIAEHLKLQRQLKSLDD